MPKQTIRAPFARDEAEQLTKQLFRKQVLKFGEIDYHGRKIVFDKPYADNVVVAFRDSAFDTVPFVLADSDNKHTRDPERVRGEIMDLETTDSGLDAVIRLEPGAAELVQKNPKMGVSVSIREKFERADGKSYPAALAHVLGTFEPMLPGMSPWQTVDASVGDDDVLDLTTIDLSGPKAKEKKVGKYSEDQQEALFSRLEQLLAAMEADDDENTEDEGAEEDEDTDLTPEDIAELRAFLEAYDQGGSDTEQADDEVDAGELVNASITEHPQVVEMSNTIRQLRAENDRRSFEQERDQIVRDLGIPPAVIDLARPLLQGSGHVIELSETGKHVDAGAVMRQVFKAFSDQIRLLDLSGERGNNLDFSSQDQNAADAQARRMDRVKSIRREMNI